MKRIDVVSALIFDETKSKILLVKNKKETSTYWSLPGGAVESGETLEQGVIREAKEESGYDVEPLGLYSVRERFFPEKNHHVIFFTFLAKVVGGKIEILDPDEDIIEVKWVELAEANKAMPYQPDIQYKELNQLASYYFEGEK